MNELHTLCRGREQRQVEPPPATPPPNTRLAREQGKHRVRNCTCGFYNLHIVLFVFLSRSKNLLFERPSPSHPPQIPRPETALKQQLKVAAEEPTRRSWTKLSKRFKGQARGPLLDRKIRLISQAKALSEKSKNKLKSSLRHPIEIDYAKAVGLTKRNGQAQGRGAKFPEGRMLFQPLCSGRMHD